MVAHVTRIQHVNFHKSILRVRSLKEVACIRGLSPQRSLIGQ